jgi:hypothetical protein
MTQPSDVRKAATEIISEFLAPDKRNHVLPDRWVECLVEKLAPLLAASAAPTPEPTGADGAILPLSR